MSVRGWLAAPVIALAALVAAGGCTSGNSGQFATVSGTVTHNGAPVDGAKVNFFSTVEGGGQKQGAYSAMTDSSGKYLIATMGKDPGIPPGLYKVTITKMDLKSSNLPPDWDQGQIDASGMAKNTLPAAYESLNTTKLSVTLEPGKNPDKNFDLKGVGSSSGPAKTP